MVVKLRNHKYRKVHKMVNKFKLRHKYKKHQVKFKQKVMIKNKIRMLKMVRTNYHMKSLLSLKNNHQRLHGMLIMFTIMMRRSKRCGLILLVLKAEFLEYFVLTLL